MNGSCGRLLVLRGVVTTARQQMQSFRIDRQSGYGRINVTPELWLRDEEGKEHRFQGDMFETARPGHEVAVISRPGSGKPLAFANFTTGVVHDGDALTISTSVGSTIISTLGLSVLLALPGALVWAALLDTIGLGDQALTATGFQVYAIVLIGCVYVGLRIWSKSYGKRTKALRDEIDRLLASEIASATRT